MWRCTWKQNRIMNRLMTRSELLSLFFWWNDQANDDKEKENRADFSNHVEDSVLIANSTMTMQNKKNEKNNLDYEMLFNCCATTVASHRIMKINRQNSFFWIDGTIFCGLVRDVCVCVFICVFVCGIKICREFHFGCSQLNWFRNPITSLHFAPCSD